MRFFSQQIVLVLLIFVAVGFVTIQRSIKTNIRCRCVWANGKHISVKSDMGPVVLLQTRKGTRFPFQFHANKVELLLPLPSSISIEALHITKCNIVMLLMMMMPVLGCAMVDDLWIEYYMNHEPIIPFQTECETNHTIIKPASYLCVVCRGCFFFFHLFIDSAPNMV